MAPETKITKFGGFLRRTSIDELPQLFSVCAGHMSLVGPRPVLESQQHLIDERTRLGINQLGPGITGWAQINGRDKLTTEQKLLFELEYKNKKSLFFDWMIVLKTLSYVVQREA